MKRVLTAAVLIPIVILALFKAPLWLFTLLVFGVAVLAAHEYFGIVKAQGFVQFAAAGYVFLTAWFFGIYSVTSGWVPHPSAVEIATARMWSIYLSRISLAAVPLLAPLVMLLLGLRADPLSRALPSAAASYTVLPYVGFTLGLLPLFRAWPSGPTYVLFLMLLVWCGDIAAYYFGRAMGKHKLAPRVSPGKSWEGAIASVVAAILVSWLLFHFVGPISTALRNVGLLSPFGYTYYSPSPITQSPLVSAPMWLILLFGAAVNVSAQLGDLVESALKRGAGVKDSGALLPGHGGILDRIDALLFALPVGLIFYLCGLSKYFNVV